MNQEIKENPCWLCSDYIDGCTQESMIIRTGRPCGQVFLKALEELIARPNPLRIKTKKPWYRRLIDRLASKTHGG